MTLAAWRSLASRKWAYTFSVGVAEAPADSSHWHAGGEQLGGVEVPEVVEADAVQADSLADTDEPAGDGGDRQRPCASVEVGPTQSARLTAAGQLFLRAQKGT